MTLWFSRCKGLSDAGKVIFLTEFLIGEGAEPPFFLRFIAQTLKRTRYLCEIVLKTPVPDLFTPSDLVGAPVYPQKKAFDAPQDFKRVFSFGKGQLERLRIQNKKVPAFQKDSGKVAEILSGQTAAGKVGRRYPLAGLLFLLIVLGFMILRLFSGR